MTGDQFKRLLAECNLTAGFVPAIVNDTSFMFDWTREDGIEIPKDKLQKAIAELEAKTVKMVRMNPYELVTKVYNN